MGNVLLKNTTSPSMEGDVSLAQRLECTYNQCGTKVVHADKNGKGNSFHGRLEILW